ncbi:fibroblast growth factor 4-like [Pocillopora verrucosa]|uniref:fibroblast growth factor 4-like n=1 Tax=Pocillopora verrucosa TaxID=203993 RepID=UPI000F553E70|nr:fibroblast growth factor 9-like isoform X2 [Pocillopora damicornis]XP_058962636.1 fibroblast growth factor 9-like [Pocillopora verrucosa]XP_058962637.1 fibroblast growth factor 9-like [Pocillopora verrucosa]XP_058962638.1 fibroblast growth factor 9-like [Pocillopora verrucosa]XP_058962639.1 fibroblast growth factor 9-like [Pocillopora verrucosa]XP_058962640.1 fibroblast growth factor 9-like [Pocillopora verrucosa]
MEFRMLFLSITVFVITTRLSCVSSRIKLRGSGLQPRRYKVPTYFNPRGSCDGNAAPTHKRLARLWSKLRFHLAVLSNGTLQGVNDTYCQLTNRCLFELQSCGTSLIRIKHVESGLYVAINKAGKVYTTTKSHKLDTMFVQELLPNDFFVFWSERTYRKTKRLMYLALKKNGATKNALKTSSKHKSVHFMVMHCSRHRNQRATPNC